jgi:hypothetical protein
VIAASAKHAVEGERLAAPLRAFAPVYLDALAEMPAADVRHLGEATRTDVPGVRQSAAAPRRLPSA